MNSEQPVVFVSYAREDVEAARRLYVDLKRYGADPWMDEVQLLPGQRFADVIKDAIRASKYFLALLSTRSVGKRGFVQRELREALDVLAEIPGGDIYIIPARLDACTPRDHELAEINWVDLFPSWDDGIVKILRAISITGQEFSYLEQYIRENVDTSAFRRSSFLDDHSYLVDRYSELDDSVYIIWNEREGRLYKVHHCGARWYGRYQLEPEDEKRVKRVVGLDSKAPKRNVSEPNS
jgi:TIR domain